MKEWLEEVVNENDERVWKIREELLPDLFETNWTSIVQVVQDYGALFTAEDCCLGEGDGLDYQLTLTRDGTALTLSAESVIAASCTLRIMLEKLPPGGMSIAAFAVNPRQPFPELSLQSTQLTSLGLQFVALTENVLDTFKNMQELELRQCTVESFEPLSDSVQLKMLKLSSTAPEFAKMAAIPCSLEDLSLLLHFYCQGAPWETFCRAISSHNPNLKVLSIKYLDVNDESWVLLMEALANSSLQKLQLGFTDNFVDNYRRLNETRRQQRCQALLDLVSSCHSLVQVEIPTCQHDADMMGQVETVLEANREQQGSASQRDN